MSEKRFVVENDIMYDKERETHFVKMGEVASFLNPLSSENEYLKSENEQLRQQLHIVETDCKNAKESRNHYREENEQLRKELYESEKHYLIETSDISDKPYIEEELSELKKKYGVIDDE